MFQQFRARLERRVHSHRARWSARTLYPFIHSGDRVLDVGAGDCQLDAVLEQKSGCDVVAVDVSDTNRTTRCVTVYDGLRLPFPDRSFDVVLLIFVLHHTTDPRAVLAEAQRVSRRHVIAFEDVNERRWDRWVFRLFHRWLAWSQDISRPNFEWKRKRWSELAASLGMTEQWCGPIGRQLSYFASRHLAFVWNRGQSDVNSTKRAA
ncbi:MAG: class I SAM-dependent methyltransferase [Gemmataceae bacterium]